MVDINPNTAFTVTAYSVLCSCCLIKFLCIPKTQWLLEKAPVGSVSNAFLGQNSHPLSAPIIVGSLFCG